MPFNIDDFNAVLDKHNGVQKPTLFSVYITIPPAMQIRYVTQDVTDVSLLCMTSSIPGPAIDTISQYRYGYGLSQKMPFNTVFNDQTFNFIGDGAGYIQNFFRDWQRTIMEYSSENDINDPPIGSPNRTLITMPWMLNYKDDYATTIRISVWDPTGNVETDRVMLTDAFPINATDQGYAWDLNDQFLVIPITFTFKDLWFDKSTIPSSLGNTPPGVDWSTYLGMIATIVNTGATTILPLVKK